MCTVVGSIVPSPPPPDDLMLISGTRQYVTLHRERNFADMFKNLDMGEIILDYLGSPRVLIRERREGQRERFKDATMLALKRRKEYR